MDILHVDPYTTNSVQNDLLTAGSISNVVDVSKAAIGDLAAYDALVLGSNEGGLLPFKSIIDGAIEAHCLGIGILFMHDTICYNESSLCPSLLQSCDLIQDTFLDDLRVLGIAGFSENFDYTLYDRITILDALHTIFNIPSRITLPIITPTHNNGVILDTSCNVLSINSSSENNLIEYHVASYEDEYGRIVHYSGGHNSYGKEYIATLEESMLLANILEWIKKK